MFWVGLGFVLTDFGLYEGCVLGGVGLCFGRFGLDEGGVLGGVGLGMFNRF